MTEWGSRRGSCAVMIRKVWREVVGGQSRSARWSDRRRRGWSDITLLRVSNLKRCRVDLDLACQNGLWVVFRQRKMHTWSVRNVTRDDSSLI